MAPLRSQRKAFANATSSPRAKVKVQVRRSAFSGTFVCDRRPAVTPGRDRPSEPGAARPIHCYAGRHRRSSASAPARRSDAGSHMAPPGAGATSCLSTAPEFTRRRQCPRYRRARLALDEFCAVVAWNQSPGSRDSVNFQTVVPVYPEKTEPIKAITVTRLLRLAVLVVMTGHTPCSHPDSLYPPGREPPAGKNPCERPP
jgi:hypothetical protein